MHCRKFLKQQCLLVNLICVTGFTVANFKSFPLETSEHWDEPFLLFCNVIEWDGVFKTIAYALAEQGCTQLCFGGSSHVLFWF